MLKKISLTSLSIVLTILSYVPKSLAHGSKITYQQTQSLEIIAEYDNGEPMKNAQVVIYAPKNPTQPWLKGITDNQGKFRFTPDSSLVGDWSVKVRLGGHGKIINIPISSTSTASNFKNNTGNFQNQETMMIKSGITSEINNVQHTMLQKLMMAATGIWGFIGTALFFARKK